MADASQPERAKWSPSILMVWWALMVALSPLLFAYGGLNPTISWCNAHCLSGGVWMFAMAAMLVAVVSLGFWSMAHGRPWAFAPTAIAVLAGLYAVLQGLMYVGWSSN